MSKPAGRTTPDHTDRVAVSAPCSVLCELKATPHQRMSPKRSLLPDFMDVQFHELIDAMERTAKLHKPSDSDLKKRSLTYEWKRHIDGFKFIKKKAGKCKIWEFPIYEERARAHLRKTFNGEWA